MGKGVRFPSGLWTGPAPLVMGGQAPRDQSCVRREARGWEGFRALREGDRLFASRADYGLVPLRSSWVGRLRGTGPSPAGKLWEYGFSASRNGEELFASRAGYGPVPLRS